MSDKERKLKDRASKLYAEGKLKDALKIYEEIVAQDPSELQCQIKIGDIYRKLGDRPSAVQAYEPVAHAYAEDGLLLKAIAVCKLILSVDPRHTNTQEMLASLYSKQRVPRMPIAPRPPARMPRPVSTPGAIELPEVDEEEPEVIRTSARQVEEPEQAKRAASEASVGGSEGFAGAGPAVVRGKKIEEPALPAAQWPPKEVSAPIMAWPVTVPVQTGPITIEDSVLDITVGEVEEEDTGEQIQSLLSEMDDEPLEIEAEPEPVIELNKPKIPVEDTWAGVIKIEDLDAQQEILDVKRAVEEVAESLTVDDAPSDVREAPPIELTQPVIESTGDLAEELERPQIPLFSDLPKSAFIELLVQMEMLEMSPGEYVIREGEVDDSFFVLATGRVRVVRKSDAGEVVLAFLTDGAFFGEMALLQDGARTASVIVEEESQVFRISKQVLDRVVAQYPGVASVLKNFYRQRLLSTVMATHPLFRPFDGEERRSLMEMFKSKPFPKGEVILQQGKKGTGLFLLLNGRLSVVKKTKEGGAVSLAQLGPGDLFGEMSLLTNQPIGADVKAETDCFVLRLSKKNFDEVIMTHPQILELVAQISDERKSFNEMLLNQPATPATGAILV